MTKELDSTYINSKFLIQQLIKCVDHVEANLNMTREEKLGRLSGIKVAMIWQERDKRPAMVHAREVWLRVLHQKEENI
jgi:hypothetical protein